MSAGGDPPVASGSGGAGSGTNVDTGDASGEADLKATLAENPPTFAALAKLNDGAEVTVKKIKPMALTDDDSGMKRRKSGDHPSARPTRRYRRRARVIC